MYGISGKTEISVQGTSPLLVFNFILECDSGALLLVSGLLTTPRKWQKLFRIEWNIEKRGKTWGETHRELFQCIYGPNTQEIQVTPQ